MAEVTATPSMPTLISRTRVYLEAIGKIMDLHSPVGPVGQESCLCGEPFYVLCPTASVITDALAKTDLMRSDHE